MTALARLRSPAERALPEWPEGWYAVRRSAELARGALTIVELAGRPIALARTASGALFATSAHCPHMGASLGRGRVDGEAIVCPLHHYRVDARGCHGPRGSRPAQSFEVHERFGLLFVRLGTAGGALPPGPAREDDFAWTTAPPIEIDVSWHAMMINGFDLLHLSAVHHRELVERPHIGRAGGALVLRYTSRVLEGGGVSDAVMKWAARDRIRVSQTCTGPVVVVESDLGRTRTSAVLGLLPVRGPDGRMRTRAYGAFGALRRQPLVGLRLSMARWLFVAFLRKDFAILEGQALTLEHADDPGVVALAAFLRSLPEAA